LDDDFNQDDHHRGIMQRSFEYIFNRIETEKDLVDEKGNGSAI
jgi:hypothetical protein